MDIESLRSYCLSLKGVSEDTPFGPDTLVFRVIGKIFALTGLDNADCRVNLKCAPEYALELREAHPDSILPGYHMNKKHWNTVVCDNGLEDAFIKKLIAHSYDLVVQSLKKAEKAALDAL
jgi:predicted DNA-binding protein (MmcQ/YjbR family)